MVFSKSAQWWFKLKLRVGVTRLRVLITLCISGVFGLSVTILNSVYLSHTALLYVLVPYCVSIAIAWTRPYTKAKSVSGAYGRHVLSTLIVFFSTSVILREGFICVLFFLPIYLLFASLGFLIYKLWSRNTTYSSVLPIFVLALSLEGTVPWLTFPRENIVTVNQTVAMPPRQIHENLAKPFDLQGEKHWLLEVFPMPYKVEAGSMQEGDTHRVFTRYHRWFFTNTHYGKAELVMDTVTDQRIHARFASDSTYFSNYLKAKDITITLTPESENETHVAFSLRYERSLDPAWYFHPLQRYAVKQMALFTIEEVINRGE